MKIKKTQALLCGALALFPLTAGAGEVTTYTSSDKTVAPTQQPPMERCAGPISYSNLELLYAYTEFDNNFFGDDDTHGGRLNIEYSFMQNFYLTAGTEFTKEGDLSLWMVNGGIGAYYPITENFHIAVDGGVLWVDIEFDDDDELPFEGDDSESDTGWYIKPHLRGKWGCWEVHAGALYRDVGEFDRGPVIPGEITDTDGDDGTWAGFAKLFYHLNDSWDITAGVLHDEDFTQWSAGVRWRF